MVGLATFTEFFKDHTDSYIVIGGAACDHYLTEQGFTYRRTDDIDMILVVEALTAKFVEKFWEFIEDGQYVELQKGGKSNYYRFLKPKKKNYPIRLELLSRTPDVITTPEDARFTPIPTDEDLASLSAILIDEQYYDFTIQQSTNEKGLKRANAFALICLKAKAFLNLKEERANGKRVHSSRIKKHKNDVFRVAVTLTGNDIISLPKEIKNDLKIFVQEMRKDPPDAKQILSDMNAPKVEVETLIDQLKLSFNLDGEVIE